MYIHCMVIKMAEEKDKKEEIKEEIKEEKKEKTEEEKKEKKGVFCTKCGEKVSGDEKFCPACGTPVKKDNVCPSCGNEIEKGTKFCDKCGASLTDEVKKEQPKPVKKKHTVAIVLSIIGGVLLLALIGVGAFILSIKHEVEEEERYNNLPVKVDISMSNYYGSIEYILEDFDLDFDLVTKGGNCYSGVQEATFETEKYGILHTEYSYCKSSKSLTFRLYNLDSEQELREPKQGELPTYDKYGYKQVETGGSGV